MADLVLINGNILTMNSAQPCAEAIAIVKNHIAKVGSNNEISTQIDSSTQVLNLGGGTVVPGFIDTHIHVADFGRTLQWVDLKQANSIKALQAIVKNKADRLAQGKWILGSGWNQENLAEKRPPTRQDIDAVAQDNPVILYHQLGRKCATNSRALDLAGIAKTTVPPQDGIIEKSQDTGEPTGILSGTATDLVWKAVPQPTDEEMLEYAKEACKKIVEAGITSIHWIAQSATELAIAEKLMQEGEVPLNIFLIITDEVFENSSPQEGKGGPKIGGVLIFSDGYLASQTAALETAYVGNPTNKGQLLYTQEELDNLASKIQRAKLQVIIHAMGDKAVDAALKTLQNLPKRLKGRPNRIEQAALLNRQLTSRLRKLQPVVSIQPKVIESEFKVWSAVEHLGETRAKMLFPLKTLLKKGIHVVSGSDCPMEPLNPTLGIQYLVTRKPFHEERLTVEQALRLYTVDAAYATGEETIKGSIEEGKLADLTVLSENPTTVAQDMIGEIVAEMTIIGGKVAYRKPPR